MSTKKDVVKYLLGEGGWCLFEAYNVNAGKIGSGIGSRIKSTIVPYTNASVTRSHEVPFVETSDVPWSNEPRSKIRLGHGIYTFSGSLGFELTDGLRNTIFTTSNTSDATGVFFARNNMFDLVIADTDKISLEGCVWNSFSMSCNVNQLPTCELGFDSLNLKSNIDDREEIILEAWTKPPGFKNDAYHSMGRYWQYGVEDIMLQNFSISISRSVTPVFLNNPLKTPTYFHVGKLEVGVSFTCATEWFTGEDDVPPASFSLGDGYYFQLLNAYQQSKNYTFRDLGSLNTKTYTMNGTNNSTSEVFRIIKK